MAGVGPLKILVREGVRRDYTVETPRHVPLGGSQSAICYLTVELARLGHGVTLLNRTSTPGIYSGVSCVNSDQAGGADYFSNFDVLIASNVTGGRTLRDIGVKVPAILWFHNGPSAFGEELRDKAEQDAWDAFVFVSEWQRDQFVKIFELPREKTAVIRNAASPVFTSLPVQPAWFETGISPILFYASIPFRGLEILLEAFPRIRNAVCDARLRIFSSMALYNHSLATDQYRALYERAAQTDGVEYIGPLAQPQLAQELSSAAILAYPCTSPETSCIVAIEAMAIGAKVVITDYGALSETTNGFARLVELTPNRSEFIERFADAVIETLRAMRADPKTAANSRSAQIEFTRQNYNWPNRAREWDAWLTQLIGRR